MAKYNRDFLVPYLHNICALELLFEKLHEIYWNYDREVKSVQNIRKPEPPSTPQLRKQPVGSYIALFGIGFGILACVIAVLLLIILTEDKGFFGWLIIAFFGFLALMLFAAAEDPYDDVSSTLEYNRKAKEGYERDCSTLEQRQHNWEHRMDNMGDITNKRDFYFSEWLEAGVLLEKLYDVNVIPGQYRTKYAAIYLHDYFSKSQEDDLAIALNTFVLEEIKEKLDTIIENQSEMMIYQRRQIALQQKSIESQEQHTQMMKNRLNQIQASLNEQNCYLDMIEANASATAFFVAADYIRKI